MWRCTPNPRPCAVRRRSFFTASARIWEGGKRTTTDAWRSGVLRFVSFAIMMRCMFGVHTIPVKRNAPQYRPVGLQLLIRVHAPGAGPHSRCLLIVPYRSFGCAQVCVYINDTALQEQVNLLLNGTINIKHKLVDTPPILTPAAAGSLLKEAAGCKVGGCASCRCTLHSARSEHFCAPVQQQFDFLRLLGRHGSAISSDTRGSMAACVSAAGGPTCRRRRRGGIPGTNPGD